MELSRFFRPAGAQLLALAALSQPAAAGVLTGAQVSGLATPASPLLAWSGTDYGPGSAAVGADFELALDDFSLFIDLDEDGQLRLWDNRDDASAPLSLVLRLSFSGLAKPLAGLLLNDVGAITQGQFQALALDAQTLELRLSGLGFDDVYASFGGQIQTVAEPGSLPLLALAALALARARRRMSRPA